MPLISTLDKHKFGYRGEARTLDGGRPDPLGRAQARARHSGIKQENMVTPQRDGHTGASGVDRSIEQGRGRIDRGRFYLIHPNCLALIHRPSKGLVNRLSQILQH